MVSKLVQCERNDNLFGDIGVEEDRINKKYKVSHLSISVDQRALQWSPNIEFFLIPQIIHGSANSFLSVIHDLVVDSMEGNPIRISG